MTSNLHYPYVARESNIEGRAIVKFTIDEMGNIYNVSILRSIGGGCDEEAKRIIASMPSWAPATYKKERVKATEILPIVFKLAPPR